MPDGQASRSGAWSDVTIAAPSGAQPRIDTQVAIAIGLIAVVSFILHLGIARTFDRLGVFFFNDILFASDTRDFLASISHGERSVRTIVPDLLNSVHPYIWFYFAPLVRGLAGIAAALGLTDNVYDARLAIGVVVTPAVAALQGAAFAVLLHLLRFPLVAIVPLSLLNMLAFSGLLYGSLPDHFMVTNLAITTLMIAAVVAYRWPRFDHLGLWIPLGLVATGITTTNIVFVGIVHFVTRLAAQTHGVLRSAARSSLLCGTILVFVVASADFAGYVLHGAPNPEMMKQDFISRYMRLSMTLSDRIARAAASLENSIAPMTSDIGTLAPPKTPSEWHPVSRPPTGDFAVYPRFTFEAKKPVFGDNPLGMIAIVGVVAGAVTMVLRGGIYRAMGAIALSIVAFNLVLHSLWGDEYVLYSQHWMAAALVLLAGTFLVGERWRWGVAGAVLVFAIAVGVNNSVALAEVIGQLRDISTAVNWPR